MDLEIEYLLFKKIARPKDYLMTRIINLLEEDGLIKKRIVNSCFCHYYPGELNIMQDKDIRKNIFQ